MEFDTKLFAASITAKRGDVGLRDTAKAIGGVSAATLSRLERGYLPDVPTLARICDWLNVSPAVFFGCEVVNEPTCPIQIATLRFRVMVNSRGELLYMNHRIENE